MNVEISLYGPLRDETGRKVVTLEVQDGATIRDVLDELVAEFPGLDGRLFDADGTVDDQVVIAKNKRSIEELDGPDTPLEDGDAVRLSPPVVGGTGV